MLHTSPKTVTAVESFVDLLKAACHDSKTNAILEKLLSMPDEKQQGLIHAWITDMMIAGAPQSFIQAIACLIDDAVAEKAYEAIYHCKRGEH